MGAEERSSSDGNTSNGNDEEQQMKLCLLALAHLLLWGLVPNWPQTITKPQDPGVGDAWSIVSLKMFMD